jgi:hypothetical protein
MTAGRPFSEHYNLILNNMKDTFEKKNHDYGDSTQKLYEQFNESYFIRIADKFNRINTLLTNNNDPKVDEKLEDTILDLANYCVLWLANKNYVDERESLETPKNADAYDEHVSIYEFDSIVDLIQFVDDLIEKLE